MKTKKHKHHQCMVAYANNTDLCVLVKPPKGEPWFETATPSWSKISKYLVCHRKHAESLLDKLNLGKKVEGKFPSWPAYGLCDVPSKINDDFSIYEYWFMCEDFISKVKPDPLIRWVLVNKKLGTVCPHLEHEYKNLTEDQIANGYELCEITLHM